MAAYFGPELFAFFRKLAKNNNREWFNAHKADYERDARDPMLRFIAAYAPRLAKLYPSLLADPRPVGGSMLRIHRDTRFSNDKTPYKTWAAAQFRHARGRDIHAPGLYFHLQPDSVFFGAGMWHPDPKALGKIRDAIVEDPDAWKKATRAKAVTSRLKLAGDSLKRPPNGYAADHPLIEDLKRKDFILTAELTEKDAMAPDFIDRFTELCKAAAPTMSFLTRAIGF